MKVSLSLRNSSFCSATMHSFNPGCSLLYLATVTGQFLPISVDSSRWGVEEESARVGTKEAAGTGTGAGTEGEAGAGARGGEEAVAGRGGGIFGALMSRLC